MHSFCSQNIVMSSRWLTVLILSLGCGLHHGPRSWEARPHRPHWTNWLGVPVWKPLMGRTHPKERTDNGYQHTQACFLKKCIPWEFIFNWHTPPPLSKPRWVLQKLWKVSAGCRKVLRCEMTGERALCSKRVSNGWGMREFLPSFEI